MGVADAAKYRTIQPQSRLVDLQGQAYQLANAS